MIRVESVSPEIGLFDRADHPDQDAGHGGEEEAGDEHHDRGDDAAVTSPLM